MSELGKLMAANAIPMNAKVMEGFTYHELKDSTEYIEEAILHASTERTKTHLRYLGYRRMLPEEVVKHKFGQAVNRPYNLAPNDLYYCEYKFQYGSDEEHVYNEVVALPFLRRGNEFGMGGKGWTIMPTIMDKVISIGDDQVFVDITTAKYIFKRSTHTVVENGHNRNIPIVIAELYRNQSDRLAPTTNAKPTMMHYLLSYYGYSKTMQMLLGFIPQVVVGRDVVEGKTTIMSQGGPPDGYYHKSQDRFELDENGDPIKTDIRYTPNKFSFVVDEDKNSPELTYVLGNILYILDHFPNKITLDHFDDPIEWRKYIGEIIHSGNHTIPHLLLSMRTHFNGYTKPFDNRTIRGLAENDVDARNFFELLVVIFNNFNTWIAMGSNGSFYNNKRLDAKSQVLGIITHMFTNLYFDIYKEESKIGGAELPVEAVRKAFRSNIKERMILSLKRKKLFVQITEDSTCHLWFKGTSFVNKQEGSSVNVSKGSNTSSRHKLNASMATTGNLLYLSKRNSDPCIKTNSYIHLRDSDGTILLHPDVADIIHRTEKKLTETHNTTRINDLSDGEDPDVDRDDDLYDQGDFGDNEDDFSDLD